MSSYYCNSDNVINYVTHPNCSPNTNIAKDVEPFWTGILVVEILITFIMLVATLYKDGTSRKSNTELKTLLDRGKKILHDYKAILAAFRVKNPLYPIVFFFHV